MLGFIDVPGHEKLVHTMAAGACGIDFALVVIAADDGVMPQTREHLSILQLLGVAHGALALTKCDRVDAARVARVRDEIRAWLAASPLADAPVFETRASEPDDAGVAALNAHLRDTALAWRARRDDGLFRLAVDRVFTLAGQGTVVTGTAVAGRVRTGDSLAVARTGETVRVRSIHAQNRATDVGHAGERCALNLAGIDKAALARGDAIVDARLATLSPRIDVELTLTADADLTITHWTPLHVHLGTLHRVAHVALLEGETLGPGRRARAQLNFTEPVFAAPGDRFIVRDAQATRTVGGGRVLDPFGPARKRRTRARRAWLDALAAWLDEGRLDALLDEAPLGIARATLMHLTGLPAQAWALPADAVSIAAPGKHADEARACARALGRAAHARARCARGIPSALAGRAGAGCRAAAPDRRAARGRRVVARADRCADRRGRDRAQRPVAAFAVACGELRRGRGGVGRALAAARRGGPLRSAVGARSRGGDAHGGGRGARAAAQARAARRRASGRAGSVLSPRRDRGACATDRATRGRARRRARCGDVSRRDRARPQAGDSNSRVLRSRWVSRFHRDLHWLRADSRLLAGSR